MSGLMFLLGVWRGLCPGGLCPWGYLSGGLCPGDLCPGGSLSEGVPLSGVSLSGGSLSWQGLCPRGLPDRDPTGQRPLCTVKSEQYASYWNAFYVGAPFFVLAPSSVWQILDQLLQIELASITSKFRIETDKRIPFKTKQNRNSNQPPYFAPIFPSISFN